MRPDLARNASALLVAATLSLTTTAVSACGYCVEDRIAAVYDHGLLQRTQASQHQIVFFAWEGPMARDEASRRQLLALVEAIAGVDTGSVRVSMEPAALAVAFDPKRSSVEGLQAALQKELKALKLSIALLQMPKTR